MTKHTKYVKLEIFVPESHFAVLRQTLQSVGAGCSGHYDSCLAYSPVTGIWRPLAGADPYHGTVGEISASPEIKVEVRVDAVRLSETLTAIRAVHPYEEPVIFTIPLAD